MWQILKDYYVLDSGIAFNPQCKLATFADRADAVAFKRAWPAWTVRVKVAQCK